jgi:DNA repair exonuclease SbcCD nuclease subunit
MIRAKKATIPSGPADAILVSDLHLTDSTPVSRTDDYIQAQIEKLEFLFGRNMFENKGCPVICAGDIFDHWKASPWLSKMAYDCLPRPFVCIPGQHDLPGHSLENYHKSALALLEAVTDRQELYVLKEQGGQVAEFDKFYIVGVPFGGLGKFNPKSYDSLGGNKRKILVLHELIWPDKLPGWCNGKGWTSDEIIDRFGAYFDLILTGDNHQSFLREKDETVLVNPGSMMRINADQADFHPKCYLYFSATNQVEPAEFPIKENVHNREHIDAPKERDERITAYIERMKTDWELGFSFRKNLEAFFTKNKTPGRVREIVWGALEKINN